MTDQLAQQGKEVEAATANLNEAGKNVPEELAPAVDKLTATLKAVEDPRTPPQEREEVTEIAEHVTSALARIADPETPRELREQLTVIVQQVASALEGSHDPQVSPELRATTVSTAEKATSALDLMGDPGTPPELQEELNLILKPLTAVLAQGSDGVSGRSASPAEMRRLAGPAAEVARATEMVSDPKTPPQQRSELARATAQAAATLPALSDPGGSQSDQAKAQEVFRQKSEAMKKAQEKAASARDVPDVPLGEAAAVCTNAIFTSVSDRALGWSLKNLLPPKWENQGVKDFWKVREKGDDSLVVMAQLQNGEHTDAPFDVGQLTARLAQLVPAKNLFGQLGIPGLHCLQAAWHLDRQGIEAGTWAEKAQQKKGAA
ncbi:hypothetical protein [Streptomyces pristinaespiralis]|uniref:hypothetical protein n=1 Tax=Streptomyces pristinaespiralis TaxID=38300 RepID=UPI0033EE6C89